MTGIISLNRPLKITAEKFIPTIEEIKKACKVMKMNKAISLDNINDQLFHHLTSEKFGYNLQHYQEAIKIEGWVAGTINYKLLLLSKRDDDLPPQISEIRPLAIPSRLEKMAAALILPRIKLIMTRFISRQQFGFQLRISTSEAFYTLNQIILNRRRNGLASYVLFFDLKKAYDNVDQNLLLQII